MGTDGTRPKRRTSRTAVRLRPSSARLTERDRWLLEALAKMRFLTTMQVAQLFFGSRSAANKRLRRLFDAGLVRVWSRSLAADNVYSVTRASLRVLQEGEQATEPDRGAGVPRGLDGNLEHLLAINQVRLGFALAQPAMGGGLGWWWSDWELRAHGRSRVVPDALFGVRWDDGGEQAFSLEMDHNTKSPRRFLAKLLHYVSMQHAGTGVYGVRDFTILVVGNEPRWIERYREAFAHMRVPLVVWFATLEEIEAAGPLGEVWRGSEGDRRCSLRELASLPCRKEEDGEEAGTLPGAYGERSARLYTLRESDTE